LASLGCNAASGQDVERDVQGQSPRMKQVQRPKVHGPAGQVRTTGRLSNNGWFTHRIGERPGVS